MRGCLGHFDQFYQDNFRNNIGRAWTETDPIFQNFRLRPIFRKTHSKFLKNCPDHVSNIYEFENRSGKFFQKFGCVFPKNPAKTEISKNWTSFSKSRKQNPDENG